MNLKYAYVSKETFPDGEISVMAQKSDGEIIFGFRTRDYWGWKEQARRWLPPQYVFVYKNDNYGKLMEKHGRL